MLRIEDPFDLPYYIRSPLIGWTMYLFLRLFIRVVAGRRWRRILFPWLRDFPHFLGFIFCRGYDAAILHQHGVRALVRLGRRADFPIFSGYEANLIRHFTPRQGEIVIDAGANIGLYTLLAAKKVGKKGKVLAIEPIKDTFQVLNYNISLNNFQNRVRALNCAMSNSDRPLFIDSVTGKSAEFKVAESGFQVQGMTLTSLIEREQIKSVNWVKMDVEGHEFEVLEGARPIINRIKRWIIEVHDPARRNEMERILRAESYVVHWLDRSHIYAFRNQNN